MVFQWSIRSWPKWLREQTGKMWVRMRKKKKRKRKSRCRKFPTRNAFYANEILHPDGLKSKMVWKNDSWEVEINLIYFMWRCCVFNLCQKQNSSRFCRVESRASWSRFVQSGRRNWRDRIFGLRTTHSNRRNAKSKTENARKLPSIRAEQGDLSARCERSFWKFNFDHKGRIYKHF